jgi:hypothetical protein
VIDGHEVDGDVITDRTAADLVPEAAQVSALPQPLDKFVTLRVAYGDPSWQQHPPMNQVIPGLSFNGGRDGNGDEQGVYFKDSPGRPLRVKDIFHQWTLPIGAAMLGRYRIVTASVNGVAHTNIADYAIEDGDVIEIVAM